MQTSCPYCGATDPDTATRSSTPTSGDFYECPSCSRLSVFADAGELRRPTQRELDESANDWHRSRQSKVVSGIIGFDARG